MIIKQNRLGFTYVLEPVDNQRSKITLDNKTIIVEMSLNQLEESWEKWQHKNVLIQHAFPKLDADEREFLLTGLTSGEWEKMFGEEGR